MALTAAIDLTVKKPDFKSMKAEIKELTIEAQQAVMEFGEFSPEAIAAEKALAGARDRMDDFNDRVKAVNPDKFAQVNTVVQGVARGFQAAQGAMALFGNQSEELEKTMVKLQGAMALAEGLEGLGKIQQQFKAIFTDVVSGAKKAFAAIKAGIGSTGIGLLVVALGAIVAYWDDIKASVSGVTEEQKKLNKETGKNATLEQEKLNNLNAQDNILKLQGKSEKDILAIKLKQTETTIAALEASILNQETTLQAQTEAAKRNKDILQGMIRFVTAPLTLLLKGIDMAGKAFGKDFGLEEGFSGGIAKMIFDPEEIKTEGEAAIKEAKTQLLNLKNTAAGIQLQLREINKPKATKAKTAEEEAKEEQAANDKINEQNLKRERKFFEELNGIQRQGLAANLDNTAAWDKINEEQRKKTEAARAKDKDDQLKTDAAIKQSKEDLYNVSIDLANAVIGLAGEQSKTGKALALSVIAADTAMAISGALKVTQSASPDNVATGGLAGAAKYIGLAAMILNNAKKARDILKSGQPSAPSPLQVKDSGMPQMAAPRIASGLPQVEGFDQRVYVTEGDISRTQARVSNTKRVSVVK